MWEPVGPLPAAVYWRRRWVALASMLTLSGLLAAGVGGHRPVESPIPVPAPAAVQATAEGRSDGPAAPRIPSTFAGGGGFTTPTASYPSSLYPSSLYPSSLYPSSLYPSSPTSAARGSGSPTSTGQGRETAQAGSTPASPDPFTAASVPELGSTSSERIRPDDTPRPAVAAQSPVPVPRTGPVPCTNPMLAAAAEVDPAVHKVGSHPVLRLVLTNISGQPCVRDLDASRQEIVVWSSDGATRLWSSNDCLNNPTTDLRTLVPGRPVAFSLTWGERTTTPGCAQPRTVVPAGSYRLMVRLDDLISPPTPFLRTV
ncbi:hypothetical protein [Pseudonocardia charpentierae]|uniref:MucR family transcriptional regulator n=1 Tax=Pseudonocardia charpentierae TaxID=3075545 RepID=A0ABU2N2L0_9PSEU|nr:hypothetical protein [Pseudonocardia sp. DSM 45834]MDT0347986.1 hypothetical protein [Pseudonocardia sp. DSM 45834]